MEEKGRLLDGATQPPPYYDAPAYPRTASRWRRHLFRGFISLRLLASCSLALSLLWLCASIRSGRQTQARLDEAFSTRWNEQFDDAVAQCSAINVTLSRPSPESRTENSRWSTGKSQEGTVILRNATLFDGEKFLSSPVDITFSKGLIESVAETASSVLRDDAVVYDLHGRYVTPGLVDMHSHHMAGLWPSSVSGDDVNEMHPSTGAFTPSSRIIDALKAYDIATDSIVSGGVTTSLIIPGSANLLAGEGTVVKNVLYSGDNSEPVVEELLLERGLPVEERHRYMKMAYGENPKRVWGYTRQGNAWHLREQLQKGKVLMEKQDDFCAAISQASSWDTASRASFIQQKGKFPFKLELESTIALLRGKILVQNHNYEPQDIETMLRISREFGFRVSGFHHATEAWQIPELLKHEAENVTVAIFSEFSLYKWEAYHPSLYAGHILDSHGVSIAYKSDHSGDFTNAKYLMNHAAVGHSFLMDAEHALQAVTSRPARAIDLDYRVGYCRPGYDADITIWNMHPLSVGATPLQVFIDGMPQLDPKKVQKSMPKTFTAEASEKAPSQVKPQMRYEPDIEARENVCSRSSERANFVISGIQKAFVDNRPELAAAVEAASEGPLDLVISNGKIRCLGSKDQCEVHKSELKTAGDAIEIHLQNGHMLPGLTAMTGGLGMNEIADLDESGDGDAGAKQKIDDPESLSYSKYGVTLDGKLFARARLGGVTRAISHPFVTSMGLVQGVSVEFVTSGKKSLLDGGIVQENVALHVTLGDMSKGSEDTVSNAVKALRKMLKDGGSKHNETIYGEVASGELPLVIACNSQYDISQVIMMKKDFPSTKIVILGGSEAPFVAKELAEAKIPVLLSQNRPSRETFRAQHAFVGPPLTPSVAHYLTEAGVEYAIALYAIGMPVDWRINSLGPEAGWAAMYAGLSEKEAVQLVTTNVESILGLKEKNKDIVIYEGNPLEYGATVALSFHGHGDDELEVATCFPREDELAVQSPELDVF